ncbi:uncharacterized protein GIQ15_01194 [Arthroderma uncinatum]|uniref:uncharacterized protein n=1 Tax=Arthroderma uncinatum TaxID=74035 RepID=UPI00144ABBBC|nr:uncharacterized protein GIQ15_01194 [Arthroderma uncinatum]KAF3491677.1 hypothetical protein GIQ15_01194 [Arthroderma uncinatum]
MATPYPIIDLQPAGFSPSPSIFERFEKSMEEVYGKFAEVLDPSTWTPPPVAGGHRGRYLWTDAFGVMNFLTLYREHTKLATEGIDPEKYLIFAKRLVQTVHDVLGRTRDGTSRLPRATDQEPLAGGLRIGKVQEDGPHGDGQYHHYLTQWMLALNRLSMATNDPTYNRQACSLGKAIHPHFFLGLDTSQPHMVWKMSTDLSHPLVSSEGNLDPLDGYVTYSLVQASARKFDDGYVLDEEILNYKRVLGPDLHYKPSSDTLDLGMALITTQWLYPKEDWATRVVSRCFEEISKFELLALHDENGQ